VNAVDLSLVEACSPACRLPAAEIKCVSGWLDAFETDAMRPIVIDKSGRLWTDYDRLGGEQNRVASILLTKWDKGLVRLVGTPAPAATGIPPNGAHWAHLDEHRAVLLAVTLNANANVSLVNATHLDWHASRLPAQQPHPTIDNVLLAWLNALVQSLTTQSVVGPIKVPPTRLTGSLAEARPVGVGKNHRKAWETTTLRYEWDYQHGTVEEYSMSGVWQREARPDGTTTKTTGGQGRVWGR
jgi:hypothetical protein